MKSIVSPAHMRECEERFFRISGISSAEMMFRAASALCEQAEAMADNGSTICIACGPGGNGGDGYACAVLLNEKGYDVRLFESEAPRSSDTKHYARIANEHDVRHEYNGVPALWIDCLYGTGLSRCPNGKASELIDRINNNKKFGARVLACDIPSGLNGKNGVAYEYCVHADVTLTFHMAKCGHYLSDGIDMCGDVLVRDIGFPVEDFDAENISLIESDDAAGLLYDRKRDIHKGNCGHLLIIAGSRGMAGAAALCAGAALHSGAGLVSIACPESIVSVLQILEPCAMCIPLPETSEGVIAENAAEILKNAFPGKSAVACGCGWTRHVSPVILKTILESGLPCVVDADALNILSENSDLKELLCKHHILTPHPGEAARLLGHTICDPIADAGELCINGCCTVLKGASSIISDVSIRYISRTGSPAMARGGSGDILTGITGALLADRSVHRDIIETAYLACELHGLAGEAVERKYGRYYPKSSDQIEALADVFNAYDV